MTSSIKRLRLLIALGTLAACSRSYDLDDAALQDADADSAEWLSYGRDYGEQRFSPLTQISDENPFVRFGKDAWAEFWHKEAFVRRESRIPAPDQESDLFEGLADATPGAWGWGPEPQPSVTTGAP